MKDIDLTKPGISFVTGSPISLDVGLLVLSIDALFDEREPHSLLVIKDKKSARSILIPSNCCDVSIVNNGEKTSGFFLCEDGGVWIYNGNDIEPLESARINGCPEILRSQTFLNGTRHYVVGGGNTVYIRNGMQPWNNFDIGTAKEIEQYKYMGFEKVVSSNDGVVYLFGWHGVGYIFDQDETSLIDLPVGVDLYDATFTDDGVVYACGDKGVVVFGRGVENWEIIKNEITGDKLWGISTYNKRIILCSSTCLYEIVDGELQLLVYSESSEIPAFFTHKLKSCGDCVWSIGSKQLVQYDGVSWHEILKLG
jgi:hypothetical protein